MFVGHIVRFSNRFFMSSKFKIIFLLGGLVIIMIGLAATLIILRRPGGLESKKEETESAAPTLEAGADDAASPEKQILTTAASAALKSGRSEPCLAAGDQIAIDQCLYILATDQNQKIVCDQIQTQETKARCQDTVLANQADQEKNPDLCLTLSTSIASLNCLFRAAESEKEIRVWCSKLESAAQTQCEEILNYEDPSPIFRDTDGDNLYDQDETRFGTDPNRKDTDGDGLSDFEEVSLYRTSPLKSDTDGDSFADGLEVKAGYNPLGSGRLP